MLPSCRTSFSFPLPPPQIWCPIYSGNGLLSNGLSCHRMWKKLVNKFQNGFRTVHFQQFPNFIFKKSNCVLQRKKFYLNIKICPVCTINEVVFSEETRACTRNDEGVRKEEKGILSQAAELFFCQEDLRLATSE